jgi:hypothetical protein
MDPSTDNRTRWPRVTLVLPPEARDALHELAHDSYRTARAEALRLLLDAIERERSSPRPTK